MNICDADGCDNFAERTRGVGAAKQKLCFGCYQKTIPCRDVVPPAPVLPAPAPTYLPEVARNTVLKVPAPEARMMVLNSHILRAQREAESRYRAVLAWLPRGRLFNSSEVAAVCGCSKSQALAALRRGCREKTVRVWPNQGYSAPEYQLPSSHAAQVIAYLEKNGKSNISSISAAIGISGRAIHTAAKGCSQISFAGRGILQMGS